MNKLLPILVALPLAGACAAEIDGPAEEPDLGTDRAALEDYIISLPELPLLGTEPKTPVECDADCPDDEQEGQVLCHFQRYRETGQYSEFVAFQPDSAALWPGSIVQGDDAQYGFFTPVGVTRAPLVFSMSLENLSSTPVGRMNNPSLSEFREQRNKILAAGVTGATPAAIDFEVRQVHSDSQVSLALGASVLWPGGANVTAGFNFDATDKRTKILVNYTQAYYTIDIDAPVHPSDFFTDDILVEDLRPFTSPTNPPLYVQSITYGRRVIFTLESSETADKVRAALEAAYQASFTVDGKLEVGYQKVLEESRIHAFVLGGSGAEAAGAIAGYEGLLQYITSGGDYSKDSPGAPIAYKMAYLDNATTKFAFTTEYTERICERNRADIRAELTGIDHVGGSDVGGNIELYGWVGIRYPLPDDPVVDCDTGGAVAYLWDLEDGQWIEFPEYSSWVPTSPIYIDLTDVPIGMEQSICLFTAIWEEDTATYELSGDDFFGSFDRQIDFETGWPGDHVLQPRGEGEDGVDVRVKLTVQ